MVILLADLKHGWVAEVAVSGEPMWDAIRTLQADGSVQIISTLGCMEEQ